MTDTKQDSSIWLNNRYQLQQAIGAGGMAIVYKGFDTLLERTIAVKILKIELSKDQKFVEQFRTEAKSAANLSHKNIVTIYDFGIDQDRLFMVMEYIQGTTLKSIIKQQSPMPIEKALPYIIQSASSIGYAHRAGIIHCDVKPQNILVTDAGRVKITDFGIARALSSISPDERHQVVWGSPQYFSPEQAAGFPPTMASDVYALGVILYEILTGKLPFISSDPSELARLHREEFPTEPIRINNAIPMELNQIVMKVLSKEPSARYRTADQLARILRAFLEKQNNQSVNISSQSIASQQDNGNHGNGAQPSLQQPAPKPEHKRPIPEKQLQPGINSIPQKRIETRKPVLKNTDANEDVSASIDWITVLLGFFALLFTSGLIPFWLWIWYRIQPTF
jgi:eukaryotic-like serine/threonine-protein kinase